MRKITSIATLLLLMIVSACTSLSGGDRCGDRIVTVNHAAAALAARPEKVELCPGDTLTINIRPPIDAGKAHTIHDPSDPPAAWLSMTNADKDKIVIPVPNTDIIFAFRYWKIYHICPIYINDIPIPLDQGRTAF